MKDQSNQLDVSASSRAGGAREQGKRPARLADALNAIVPFEDQDPDEQFYPARCGQGKHYWHENACHEGDTCNCGAWYRFADRIEETVVRRAAVARTVEMLSDAAELEALRAGLEDARAGRVHSLDAIDAELKRSRD